MQLTTNEIKARIEKFYDMMNTDCSDWDSVIIVDNVNQYYFTGTMQDAVLVFKRDGNYKYFVRKSYDRAIEQSLLNSENICPMSSYKDIVEKIGAEFGRTYIEQEIMPYAMLMRLKKYLNITEIKSADNVIKNLRSIKSDYELFKMVQAGQIQNSIMIDIIPKILVEGMSELDFAREALHEMLKHGHHGVSRFTAFGTEVVGGQFSFGDGALVTSSFNGPAGMRPYSPAVPALACKDRKLKKGDLVFADLSFGFDGYHCDKTQVYCFKGKPSADVKLLHAKCMEVQANITKMLVPGAIPSKIYSDVLGSLSDDFKQGFMGKSQVKFLGHGVGLVVDEFPVIARGFDSPLKENMTLAIEPKKVSSQGLVGVEDTFVVKCGGAVSLSGKAKEIIEIK